MAQVSIGLPVYNGGELLSATIESVLSQTFTDFELIICDNASTDATESICRDFASRDGRIEYFRHDHNIGAAENFCRVFELSTSPLFKWVGADDCYAPEYLARTKEALDKDQSVVLSCSKVKIIDGQGRVTRNYTDAQALDQNRPSDRFIQCRNQDSWINTVYGLMRADILRKTPLMGSYPGSDTVLVAELALHGKFFEVPEFLFFRRIHEDAYSFECSLEKQQEFYTPNSPNRLLPMFHWRQLLKHAGSIRRAPIDLSEKCRLFVHLSKMANWRKAELLRELRCLVAR